LINPVINTEAVLEETVRHEWSSVLSAALRITRDIDVAEECAQEAFAAAVVAWPKHGVPHSPAAWVVTVARRRAVDAVRRKTALNRSLPLLLVEEVDDNEELATEGAGVDEDVDGDVLRLIFMCSHPSLSLEAQTSLTLRLVCGVPTPDIARLLLVSEVALRARLTRAKKKIMKAGIPFRMPDPSQWPTRLSAALQVVYLLFTSGHAAPSGPLLLREDVANQALQLAEQLRALMPEESAVNGLYALLLLQDARRATRLDEFGQPVLLADQDRSRWDRERINEAVAILQVELRRSQPARFVLEAAIAALHATAPSFEETDWSGLLINYDDLLRRWPSPVVALNRAVVIARVSGPESALAELDRLAADERLNDYHYFHSVRASLLREVGRNDDARVATERALSLTMNESERNTLLKSHAN
jgi:RNA polymerase sigma-70 factor, ECF subfamily